MRFFTLFAAILIANLAFAQSFHFVVDTLQDNVYPFHDENYIANFAVNNSEETKVMRWTQTKIFKGAKWSNAQVCDNFLCYTDKIKTKTIIPIQMNELRRNEFIYCLQYFHCFLSCPWNQWDVCFKIKFGCQPLISFMHLL